MKPISLALGGAHLENVPPMAAPSETAPSEIAPSETAPPVAVVVRSCAMIHVPLLRFLRFGEVLVDIFDSDQWPANKVALADCVEPSSFCWETAACMDESDALFN